MKNMFNFFMVGTLLLTAGYASAGTVEAAPKRLDGVTIIGNSAFGHAAGNLEIKVTGGLGSPAGVICDQNYITTKASAPSFNQMFTLLVAAKSAGKQVRLGITDDPSLTAFSGRCSLVAVTLID